MFSERSVIMQNDMNNTNGGGNYPVNNNQYIPGRSQAIASLVLGILAVICCFTKVGAFVGVILGIIGIAMAKKSKRLGYVGGMRTAGFVFSLIAVIICIIAFVAALAAIGLIASLV
jgi:hypothetical protein